MMAEKLDHGKPQAPRDLLRDAWPRRHQRQPRRPYRGPGLHAPMILFIGEVARGMREREAFQEVHYKQLFGAMAKWVVEIDDAARIPELTARAFRVASSDGRDRLWALPEDMLVHEVEVVDAPRVEPADTWPNPAEMAQFHMLLEQAQGPMGSLAARAVPRQRATRSWRGASATPCRSLPRSAAHP